MNKKTIIFLVIAAVIIIGGATGIYVNAQHQQQLKIAQEYKLKVTREKKQITDLQKNFKVDDSKAEGIVSDLLKLKVSTKEAKELQTKIVELDKQEFVNSEKQKIKKLTIPVNDKRFNEISSLQANVKAIQTELTKVKAQTSIFTSAQIKDFTTQLNILLKTGNTQISKLQKIAKEKADLEAKKKQEAETARVQAEKEPSQQVADNQSNQSQNTVQGEAQGNTAPYQSQQSAQGNTNSYQEQQQPTQGNTQQNSGNSGNGSSSQGNGWSANEDGSGKHDTNVNNNGDGTWTVDPGNGNTGGWSIGG
ncbi:hypothetical protein [Lactococcus lactis]